MLKLILVRHGETAGNLRPTALGTTDLPLNEKGARQAANLARLLGLTRPEAIYASPLKRAADTAEVINTRHNLHIDHVLDLSERDFGYWDGLSVDEIRAKYPEDYAAWQADLADYSILGGESAKEAYTRHARCIDALLKRHEEGTIICVTHMNAVRNILAHLLGMGLEGSWKFQIHTGCATRLIIDERGCATLTSLNEF